MKLVSGMQGTRNQEIVWGDKRKKREQNSRKKDTGDRQDSKNHTERKTTRGKNGMAKQSSHTRKV